MNESENRILLSGILLLFLGIEKKTRKEKLYTRGSNGSRVRCANVVNEIYFSSINLKEYSAEKKIFYENCFCVQFSISFHRQLVYMLRTSFPLSQRSYDLSFSPVHKRAILVGHRAVSLLSAVRRCTHRQLANYR